MGGPWEWEVGVGEIWGSKGLWGRGGWCWGLWGWEELGLRGSLWGLVLGALGGLWGGGGWGGD